jgi:hypothetical protein
LRLVRFRWHGISPWLMLKTNYSNGHQNQTKTQEITLPLQDFEEIR